MMELEVPGRLVRERLAANVFEAPPPVTHVPGTNDV